MQARINRRLCFTFTGLLLSTSAHAVILPALPANPVTIWTPVADTGSPAPLSHSGGGTVTTFSGFTPPVIIGSGTGTGFPQYAFKGKMPVGGGVTGTNDEGIWSNAQPGVVGPVITAPGWLVAQEGDVAWPGVTIGNTGSMTVQALQTTWYGGTLFTTNSNINAGLNLSVYEGNKINGLAGSSVGIFSNGGRAVTDGNRIAAWATDGIWDGTASWDVTPTPIHGLTNGFIRWTTALGNPAVQCSPAISEYGAVAHRARTPLPTFYTPFERDYIGADPISPSGLFLAGTQVVRRNDATGTGERFGIFHPNLMGITGGPNVKPTVAWQMNNLYTDVGLHKLGKPKINSKSLWCWRAESAAGTQFGEIARVGQSALHIPTRKFASFYALHLADDRTTYGEAGVYYGVILDSGNLAIYTRHISTVLGVTTLGTEQLIATDDPLGPAALWVPAIYPGTWPIAKLFPWFSVDPRGNVLIKATLGGGVPAAEKQCLIAAMTGANHSLEMRAQSGTPPLLPTLTHGLQRIVNFAITNPEQGPLGRGQAIIGSSLGAVINLPAGASGVFIGQ